MYIFAHTESLPPHTDARYSALNCGYVEETDQRQIYLRRFRRSWDNSVAADQCHCDEIEPIEIVTSPRNDKGVYPVCESNAAKDDPRWPQKCSRCGREFAPTDERQSYGDTIYVEPASGQTWPKAMLMPGSVYYDVYLENMVRDGSFAGHYHLGPDGHVLSVVMPGGQTWVIDSIASNCDMREDPTHACWQRRGDPREMSTLFVGKWGHTCHAGAGSIWMNHPNGWHGHLENGVLRRC